MSKSILDDIIPEESHTGSTDEGDGDEGSSDAQVEQEDVRQPGENNKVDERLRILLSLLDQQNGVSGGGPEQHGVRREDTLQYLSQLESVARRLKDQLLHGD